MKGTIEVYKNIDVKFSPNDHGTIDLQVFYRRKRIPIELEDCISGLYQHVNRAEKEARRYQMMLIIASAVIAFMSIMEIVK